MNCKKVKRLLPLFVGSDLPQSKKAAIRLHLDTCPQCREEYEMFRFSLEKTKEWLEKEKREWGKDEWAKAAESAVKEEPKVSPGVPGLFRKGWVYAVAAAAVLLVFIIGINFSFFKNTIFKAGEGKKQMQFAKKNEEEEHQKVFSMILVSQETGTKIRWFFVKDFELEVKK